MKELNMFEWGMCIGKKVQYIGTDKIEGILHQINIKEWNPRFNDYFDDQED